MPRMHGERQQDYEARKVMQAERREVTRRFETSPRQVIEITPACRCSALPFPHIHRPRSEEEDWRA